MIQDKQRSKYFTVARIENPLPISCELLKSASREQSAVVEIFKSSCCRSVQDNEKAAFSYKGEKMFGSPLLFFSVCVCRPQAVTGGVFAVTTSSNSTYKELQPSLIFPPRVTTSVYLE